MSTLQDNKERPFKIGSVEDDARCQKLEHEERAIIAEGIRQHPSLSPTAKSVALYTIKRARPWWKRMFNDEVGYSIIIYSFAAAHIARMIGATPADVEKALVELVAAEVLGTQPNRFGKGRDVYFRWPWCDVEKTLAKYAGDHLERRAKVEAEYRRHDEEISAWHNAEHKRRLGETLDQWYAEEAAAHPKTPAERAALDARYDNWLTEWRGKAPEREAKRKAEEERRNAMTPQELREDEELIFRAYEAAGRPIYGYWREDWENWQYALAEWERSWLVM